MLLDGLIGRRPRTAHTSGTTPGAVTNHYIVDTRLEFRRCGSPNRVLVGRPSQPPQLYWVSRDAAALLELLRQRPFDELIPLFVQRWHMERLDATDRLTALLSELYVSGLLKIRDTVGGGP